MLKLVAYIIVIPFIIWLLDSINISTIFKKNRIIQARIFYIVLVFIISYLLVAFLFDFLTISII